MNNLLKQIFLNHTEKMSDKWTLYINEWDRIFSPYRDLPIDLFEIGIQNGGSLEIWAKYFTNAKNIVGCDIDEKCKELLFTDPRIAFYVGDANTNEIQEKVLESAPKYDIIIDDGSHRSSDVIRSFCRYFPYLEYDGIYVIEDLHTSYWEEFEGSLYNPGSSISFLKHLADIVNHEHWRNNQSRAEFLSEFSKTLDISFSEADLLSIHSIEFINSLCVLKKCRPADNVLGNRIMVGDEEPVTEGLRRLNGSSIHDLTAKIKDDSELETSKLIKQNEDANMTIDNLVKALAEKQQSIDELEIELTAEKANAEQAVQKLEKDLATEKENAEQAVQKLEKDLATEKANAGSKEAEIEALKTTIANEESIALTKEAEIEALKTIIAKHEARFKEINLHWEALVHSKTWKTLIKLGRFNEFPDLRTATTSSVVEKTPITCPEREEEPESKDYGTWVRLFDTLNNDTRVKINAEITSFTYRPLVSIVMPTYNSAEIWLRAAIESVLAQLYTNWELCIADDCSTDKNVRRVIKEYAEKDSRIKYHFRNENGHISAASNSALSIASGEFIALLDHDDVLAETALYRVIQGLNRDSKYDVIYSDEDKLDESGQRYDPYFKPDWMPDLFNSQNFISHLGVYRKTIIDAVGGFRVGYEGAQDWDLMMRISEIVSPNNICHVPFVLYHWRAIAGSTAKAKSEKNYAEESQERTIRDHFERTNTPVKLIPNTHGFWNIKYLLNDNQPTVSIIIPTKNRADLLERCVNSILEKTSYSNYEILIVDNASDEQDILTYLKGLEQSNIARVLDYSKAFNYSAINNFAVENSNGEVVLLLNNDIEVITPDWLEEMVSLAVRPWTGAVGAKLYYPNDTIQHAGVVLGIMGVANHAYLHQPRSTPGQMARAMLTQNYSAVTGACLAVEKKKYLEVGGLDEVNLPVAFNDIDFCLKLLKAGYRNAWTPLAELYHHESASRGYEDTPEKQARFKKEVLYMIDKWQTILKNDPAYNPNLTMEKTDFSLAFTVSNYSEAKPNGLT